MSGQNERVLRFLGDAVYEAKRREWYVRRHIPPSLLRIMEPEDIVSDAGLKALEREETFAGTYSQLTAWFQAIIRNIIRKRVRDQVPHAPLLLGDCLNVRAESPGLASQAQARESARLISAALRTLPRKHSILFLAVHLHGVRVMEAARTLGSTPPAASSALYRAKGKLRGLLKTLEPT